MDRTDFQLYEMHERIESLENMLEKATIRLSILEDRMRGCEEVHPGTHEVSLLEIPGWVEEQEALLNE